MPAPRVIHYPDPATASPLILTREQLLARQRREQALYARWAQRQAEIAERDRKVRRFWLGFGAITGLAVVAFAVAAVWLAWTVIGLLAIPAVVLGGAGLVAGGQRCITVVQHWH
jgi:hypothetical protein